MKTLSMMILGLLWIFGITHPASATKAYVTDSFEITHRTGPSNENKITSMLFSGRPVDVLDTQGEWSRVKVLDSDKEGWVLSRYLVTRLPWEVQARKLQEEIAGMSAKLTRLDKESADQSQQRQGLASELKR
jgi:SH3 domain protein